METQRLRRWGVAGTLVGALALGGVGGCGTMDRAMGMQTWTLNTSDSVQTATGKVLVGTEKDGNTKVKVQVQHLAPPATVAEDSAAYVVWLKPAGGDPQNVGVLKVGKDLKGELETRTPFKQFQVIVTAEPVSNVRTPQGPPVMNQEITVPT
jgi:hypothetical protein